MGLVLSLILMLVYYLAFIGGTRIADNAQFSPFLGAWLPNIAFAAIGIVLLARSDREYENVVLEPPLAVDALVFRPPHRTRGQPASGSRGGHIR